MLNNKGIKTWVIIFIFWESARKSGAHIFSERERERRSENF